MLGCCVAASRKIDLHGEDVVGCAANIDGTEPGVGFEEQARRDEQDDGETDLEAKQYTPETHAGVAAAVAAGRLLQGPEDLFVVRRERGDEAGEKAAEERYADREQDDHAVDVDGVGTGDVVPVCE